MGDLPENTNKVKSTDDTYKTLKKETDAEISRSAEKTLATEEQDSGCNNLKPKRLMKVGVFKLRSI